MTAIIAETLDSNWVNLSFEYDEDIIDLLRAIPRMNRRYHPEDHTWSVKQVMWSKLLRAFDSDGFRVVQV